MMSMCPGFLWLQFALVWPQETFYPCNQQYPMGSPFVILGMIGVGGSFFSRFLIFSWDSCFCWAAMSWAMREVIWWNRSALVLVSWLNAKWSVVVDVARFASVVEVSCCISAIMCSSHSRLTFAAYPDVITVFPLSLASLKACAKNTLKVVHFFRVPVCLSNFTVKAIEPCCVDEGVGNGDDFFWSVWVLKSYGFLIAFDSSY